MYPTNVADIIRTKVTVRINFKFIQRKRKIQKLVVGIHINSSTDLSNPTHQQCKQKSYFSS